jgi:hypothetical protein
MTMRPTQATPTPRVSSAWKYPAALFLSQRVLLSLLGVVLFVAGMVPRSEDPILRPYFGVEPVVEGVSGALLGVWQRFDAIHFQRIAQAGYVDADLSPFYPLFPALSRALGWFFGGNVLLGGFLVANLATLLALIALYGWLLEEGFTTQDARRVLLLLVWFPTAFFLFVPYSESLLLLFVVLCLRSVRQRRWLLAGALAGLACLTRIAGIVLTLVIMVEWFLNRKSMRPRESASAWFAAFMPVICLVGFEWWRVRSGLPGTLAVQAQFWHRVPAFPWEGMSQTIARMSAGVSLAVEALDLIIVLGMLAAGIVMVKALRAGLVAYHWAFLLINLSQVRIAQPLSGQARYAALLFPAFIWLAGIARGPLAWRALSYSFLLLNVLLAGQFILWGWVG